MAYYGRNIGHSGINEIYWDKLDNAAKLFPAITSTRSPNVFRFTAVLRDEVDPDVLKNAVEQALTIMPAFSLKLHRGFFWYYFDFNDAKPIVREEHNYPCAPIYRARENGFLFRVTYYHKRINFEVYHALSDGMGAVSFMRLIVYCYYNRLLGDKIPEELIRHESDEICRDFNEDSFVLNVPEGAKTEKNKEKEPEAYHISGYRYDGTRLGILTAVIPTSRLIELAKSNGATLSEYLCALLIFSIYNTSYRRSSRSKPIVISIPVNLRGMFESGTLRNFFGHMNVAVKPSRDDTFETVLEEVKKQFSGCLCRGYFERQMAGHVNIERIPGISLVPLFIKDFVMRRIYNPSAKKYTMTLSNVGRIQLPDNIAGLVERFEMVIGGSHTHPKKASLCSFGEELALTFSSTIDDNSLEQFLVRFLTKQGIPITISSNETPAPEKAHGRTKEEKRAEREAKASVKYASKAEKRQLKEQQRNEKRQIKTERKATKKQLKAEAKEQKSLRKAEKKRLKLVRKEAKRSSKKNKKAGGQV